MAKKRIVKDKDGKQVEIDQDAIDAALAGAVTNANGTPVNPQPQLNNRVDTKRNNPSLAEIEKNGGNVESDEPEADPQEPTESLTTGETPQIAMSQQEFVNACYNLTINAKHCKYQSSKVEDKNIVEYIRSINKKIYDETQKGGFSTNVQFRVTPQDWVNVNHIFDWYKIRGFQVEVKDTTSSPYGKDVGTMNYNFTISWVDA